MTFFCRFFFSNFFVFLSFLSSTLLCGFVLLFFSADVVCLNVLNDIVLFSVVFVCCIVSSFKFGVVYLFHIVASM